MRRRAEYCAEADCRPKSLNDTEGLARCAECEYRFPGLSEDEREVWNFWNRLSTCWKVSMGVFLGLNYQEVETVARITYFELGYREFRYIQALEIKYLKLSRVIAAENKAVKEGAD